MLDIFKVDEIIKGKSKNIGYTYNNIKYSRITEVFFATFPVIFKIFFQREENFINDSKIEIVNHQI